MRAVLIQSRRTLIRYRPPLRYRLPLRHRLLDARTPEGSLPLRAQ